jgi:microcystin degradation protein MlrC
MPKFLAIAQFSHESNSFTPVPTRAEDFRQVAWLSGEAAIRHYAGTRTELGAAIDFLRAHPAWSGTFLTSAVAMPAGPVEDAVFRAILDEILAGLGSRRWDAAYLALHGAMMRSGNPLADLEILTEVRRAIGGAPLGVSFDLHANLGPGQLPLFDVGAGYKTHPHVDAYETGEKVLRHLVATAEGRLRPKGALVKIKALLPSFNMRTTDGPMAEMVSLAADIERREGLLDVSVFGGFPYADTPYAGGAVLAFADGDARKARGAAERAAREAEAQAPRFHIDLPGAAQAIAQALAEPEGLVCVVEPSDNPGSGGIGDTTGMFRALIAARPKVPTAFGFFADPGLVERAHELGVGATLEADLGGRIAPAYGAPVPVVARIDRLTDGRFRNVGPMAHNLEVDLGRTALLDVEGIKVIVTEACRVCNDPGFFTLHGIDLKKTRLLCAKAKNHFRAAFAPLSRRILDCDTAGPAALNLKHFAFKLVPQELLPA